MTRCGTDGCRVDHDMYRVHPNGQPWMATPRYRVHTAAPSLLALVASAIGLLLAAVLALLGLGAFLALLFTLVPGPS